MIRLDGDRVQKILDEVGAQDEFAQLLLGIPRFRARAEALVVADVEAAWTKAHTEGRTEGRTEERTELLTVMLQDQFGSQPGLATTARRLAHWPDPSQAVHAINSASILDEIPAEPPA